MAVDCAFNVWNAMFSLSGVIAGGLIGFFSARHISDRNIFATAGSKLNSVFAPSLVRLREGRTNKVFPEDIGHEYFLRDELPRIIEAAQEFRNFVNARSVAKYDEAWSDYYDSIKDGGVTMAQAIDPSDPWRVIEKKIQAVLHFTKP